MLEINKIYNGDCLEIMKNIDDNSIDCIVTDPPYNITQAKWDKPIDITSLFKEYNRIIKHNGVIIIFAKGLFTVDLINANRKNYKYTIIWDKVLKSNFLNAKKQPLSQHEDILVFGKGKIIYNPQMKIGEKNHSKGYFVGKDFKNSIYGNFEHQENNLGNLKYPTTIFRFQGVHPSKMLLPTQKPITLLEELIKTYSNEKYLVLDTFAGSGSTILASINTNRSFIGIELNKEHFDIANKRIEKYRSNNGRIK